jgi:transglutaminase-like putative cysteine protease
MTRRDVMLGGAVVSLIGTDVGSSDMARWLAETPHMDFNHRSVQAIIGQIKTAHTSQIDRALACFTFVRDTIKFGFAKGFWDNKASDVLAKGRGYCNTKSTLFVALAHGCGIPARQVFVDINVQVLRGLLDPGTPYVDHSYVELFIDDAWRATDAYIVDLPLFRRASDKLRADNDLLGYGVHLTGTAMWDGVAPAFSQYNINDARPIGTKVWGIFDDVAAFYIQVPDTWNKLNPILRGAMGFVAVGINQKIEAVRTGL